MIQRFPLHLALASWLTTPIVSIGMVFYTTRALTAPAEEFFPVGLTAFGIVAALAGLSSSMTPSVREEETREALLYSAEKFFHGSLLLLQVTLLVFVRDSAEKSTWLESAPGMLNALQVATNLIAVLVAVAALLCCIWGFDHANDALWANWKHRLKSQRASSPEATEAEPPAAYNNKVLQRTWPQRALISVVAFWRRYSAIAHWRSAGQAAEHHIRWAALVGHS